MNQLAVLGPDGKAIPAAAIQDVRANAWNWPAPYDRVSQRYAYRAADLSSKELAGWYPWIRSPDAEINYDRDRVVGRERDLVRNNGWATGAVNKILDGTIGASFQPIAEPDFLTLQRICPACDAVWANEFAEAAESEWRLWANDPFKFCDDFRMLTVTQIFRLALRHKLIDGESLAYLAWNPGDIYEGGARYATALRLIDPDLLSNPYEMIDTATMRNGVEYDANGRPIAYHIRRAHPNDYYNAVESMVWDRVERTKFWGRPQVIHDFDRDRTGQSRGIGIFTPVIDRFKMLDRYDRTELQQALMQAAIRTFITSPGDAESLNFVLAGNEGMLSGYQEQRTEFARKAPVEMGGVRVPRLFPGEQINSVPPTAAAAQFADFEWTVLRSIAAPTGASAEQVSLDFARANYSSIRASLLDVYQALSRRRTDFELNFANQVYVAFLEEAMETTLKDMMPKGAPSFLEMRTAYSGVQWIGPARGWVDPVKERQGAVLGLDAGFSTLKRECAQQGLDYRKVIAQREIEVKMFKAASLKLPEWGAADNAEQSVAKPQPA